MVRQKEGEPCCICPCPCEGLVDVIGKKWVLCALADRDPKVYARYAHWWSDLPAVDVRVLGR